MPKIYSMHEKGCDFAGEFAYTGRTVKTLRERLEGHKHDAKVETTARVYQYMRERETRSFTMTLLEEFEEAIEGEALWSCGGQCGLRQD